jgi:hypothetical protein
MHTIYVLIVMQNELSIQNEMQLLSPKMLIELDQLYFERFQIKYRSLLRALSSLRTWTCTFTST